MTDNNETCDNDKEIGYGKPPRHTQFVKGQSGNPKGRPKGSQNISTILNKVGQQRMKVTENGRTRIITKSEAVVLQLWNRAVSGDLNAIRVLESWLVSFAKPEENALPSPRSHFLNMAAMKNFIKRLRQSEEVSTEAIAGPTAADGPERRDLH